MSNETKQINTDNQSNHIVILGSGYAGVHACRQLINKQNISEDLRVTLISDVDHMLYVTMIYEVPAGNLAPSSIRQPIRTMFTADNVHFQKGTATEINTQNQTVHYKTDGRAEDLDSTQELVVSYDYLVSAIGSETEFFGTPGAGEHAYRLKDLNQAKELKNTLIHNFERANLETDKEKIKELLSFVVVGGGPTGVTLTAKLANLLNHELADSFPALIDYADITILEAKDTVVDRAGLWFSNKVAGSLAEMDRVSIQTGCCVDRVRPDGVVYNDGEELRSECVIWTAGVKAREIDFIGDGNVSVDNNSKRVHVTPKLHTPNDDSVYVVGDQAWVQRIDSKQPYPMRAQFAVRQGQQAGNNIIADIRDNPKEDFYWNDKGIVISVGHGQTYAEVFGIKMSGLPATIAYKSIYLMSTIGIRNKFRAMLEWFMNMFLPRDISEL